MAHQSIIDKTSRIVFVSNLPPEATEDKLKELFRRVGPVLSLKVICKETGRTKGCGYCEYKDQETALNCVRTLNNYDFGGRILKVDHALNEKTRLEMISVMQGTQNNENAVSEKAPETISKAVASLPPEQMFELLKQMKQCVQNNPGEAKNMLLQNPQLAYALLQALVVMRIVDPQIAFAAVNSANTAHSSSSPTGTSDASVFSNFSASSMIDRAAATATEAKTQPKTTTPVPTTITSSNSSRSYISQPTPPPAPSIPVTVIPPPPSIVHDVDLRAKISISQDKAKTFGTDTVKRDPRLLHQLESKDNKAGIPVPSLPPSTVPAAPQVSVPPTPNAPSITPNVTRPSVATTSVPSSTSTPSGTAKSTTTSGTPDNEKAALIMQVLRLTDAQIAMLPPEQRQSINLLKEQIAKSTKR